MFLRCFSEKNFFRTLVKISRFFYVGGVSKWKSLILTTSKWKSLILTFYVGGVSSGRQNELELKMNVKMSSSSFWLFYVGGVSSGRYAPFVTSKWKSLILTCQNEKVSFWLRPLRKFGNFDHTDRSLWPVRRGRNLAKKFFKAQIHSFWATAPGLLHNTRLTNAFNNKNKNFRWYQNLKKMLKSENQNNIL